jgi:hypothetical protein
MTDRNDNDRTTTALRAVDAALAEGAVTVDDREHRELQELALTLDALTPEARPGFEADLDRRVADGFVQERGRGRGRLGGGRLRSAAGGLLGRLRRPSYPVMAGAASLLLALVAGLAVLQSGGEEPTSLSRDGGPGRDGGPAQPPEGDPAQKSLPEDAGPAGSPAPESVPPLEPPDDGGVAPDEPNRRIERSATLTLEAPADRLEEVANEIVAVTDRRRGFVLRSSVASGGSSSGGSFDLRVPADALQATLRDLSRLGDVRTRTQNGEDITGAFVSTEDRLEAARAERRSLLRRLERADTDREARAIRQQLDSIAGQINSTRAELKRLRERTNYAAVSVTLEEKDGSGESGGGSDTNDAFDDALGSLVGAFNFMIRALGVLIPLALLAAALGLGWRTFRNRRREAALT